MENKIEVFILFFAKSRELVGKSSDTIFLTSNQTLPSVLSELYNKYPELKILHNGFIIAHNQEYITSSDTILTFHERDELAIIPPISGG